MVVIRVFADQIDSTASLGQLLGRTTTEQGETFFHGRTADGVVIAQGQLF